MAEAEKIRAYESPTRVKVLEMRNNLLKVAVVQGKHFGQVGWALKDRIQIDPNAPKTPELARQEELKERAKSERAKSIKKRK